MNKEVEERSGLDMPKRLRRQRKPKPEEVLDLWWMGCGGMLRSAKRSPSGSGGDAGVDYPFVVSLHVEGFFDMLPGGWRDLARWAAGHAYKLKDYPLWLVTPDRLIAMKIGQALTLAPTMRGRALYGHLRCLLGEWLEENPLPEQTGWFEE